jgi:hypothetical protein
MVDQRQRSWIDITREWSLSDVVPIIREVPDAKYMILNVANGVGLNPADTAILQKADVLMDTSGRSLGNLSDLLRRYGKEKFAFGTHAPILDYLTGMLRIEAMRDDEADNETKELIRSRNAKRFLDLS